MNYPTDRLPNDIEALKKLVRAERRIAEKRSHEVQKLKAGMARLQRLAAELESATVSQTSERAPKQIFGEELAETGTYNMRAAINRTYRTAMEALVLDYEERNPGRAPKDLRQALNGSAYDLLALLLSAELNDEPKKPPVELSKRVIADRVRKLDEPHTMAFVQAAMSAVGRPEKARSVYSKLVRKRRMVPTEGALKRWIVKNAVALEHLDLVKVGRYDRGSIQKNVIGNVALTAEGREFMRGVEFEAIRLIVNVSAIGDEPNREENER
jgi:hypothetical protein